MVDVIVYKPSPYALVFTHDKPIGFIIYHIKHERVYVSYKSLMQNYINAKLYMINSLGYALGFIIYHIKHERDYECAYILNVETTP